MKHFQTCTDSCDDGRPVAVDAMVGGQGCNRAGSSWQEVWVSLAAETQNFRQWKACVVQIFENRVYVIIMISNLGTDTLELRPRLE